MDPKINSGNPSSDQVYTKNYTPKKGELSPADIAIGKILTSGNCSSGKQSSGETVTVCNEGLFIKGYDDGAKVVHMKDGTNYLELDSTGFEFRNPPNDTSKSEPK